MGYTTLFLIALGLSMDAFAVSVASGFAIKNLRIHNALKIAFFFGAFQAIMPILGWFAGISMKEYVVAYDHWIAFVLLSFIGGKMIYESFQIEEIEEDFNPLNVWRLFILAIATSIDALAVGVTFACLGVTVTEPVIIIGLVTFVVCFAGVYIGDRAGKLFEGKVEVLGGVVLIGIGVKILYEHMA